MKYTCLSHENQMRTKGTKWIGFQIVAWKLRFMHCYLDLQCLTNLISSFDFQKDPVRALRMTTRQTLKEVWRYLPNFMNVFVDWSPSFLIHDAKWLFSVFCRLLACKPLDCIAMTDLLNFLIYVWFIIWLKQGWRNEGTFHRCWSSCWPCRAICWDCGFLLWSREASSTSQICKFRIDGDRCTATIFIFFSQKQCSVMAREQHFDIGKTVGSNYVNNIQAEKKCSLIMVRCFISRPGRVG
jgi:hypothetical protein